ncbi:MAG: threonine--tRNA ligase, partial [Patescibacteria group bacterium]
AGDFTDLCEGPHVASTDEIGAFKLLSLAGAYWHGDEKNPQLTRVYATAFASQKELDEHLAMLEEAKKRDHRRLGKELDLYSIHEEAGPGLIYWHPKGSRVRLAIEDFWRAQHFEHGYEVVYTPHLGRSWLWETSGHLGFYRENMYSAMEIDDQDYYIKPMNCPFHIMIYQTQTRSYRDLPLRWAELGTVYRYEKSGVLHGLLRVRGFTQDDAHIICTPDQIEDEILRVLKFSLDVWRAFGFKEIKAYLATKPEKSVGEQKDWDKALDSLRKAVETEKLEYEMDEGGGAFYGPKIDLKIKDALGREWQMTTIQFDFNLPERFGMTFVDKDGKEKRPFMVHRALLGSIERFFGVLIEHYAGAFPFWLSPVQAVIAPISDKQNEYAKDIFEQLKSAGVRAELDDRNESLGRKVRDAQTQKVPMVLVIGSKEVESKSVTLRDRDKGDLGSLPLDEAITRLSALLRG